jgi:hypothetical protein
MFKALALTVFLPAALLLSFSAPAKADLISSTLSEFTGNFSDFSATYPLPAVTIGTFHYAIPAGDVITGATIRGSFGNSSVNSTATSDYFAGAIQVASCDSTSDPCFNPADPSDPPETWSYIFTPGQLAALASGSLDFSVVQNGPFEVQSGVTELDITANSTVPEPASIFLLIGVLAIIAPLLRKRLA